MKKEIMIDQIEEEKILQEIRNLGIKNIQKIYNFIKIFEDIPFNLKITKKGKELNFIHKSKSSILASYDEDFNKGVIQILESPVHNLKEIKKLLRLFPKDFYLKKPTNHINDDFAFCIFVTKEELTERFPNLKNRFIRNFNHQEKMYINLGSESSPKTLLKNLQKLKNKYYNLGKKFSISKKVERVIFKNT